MHRFNIRTKIWLSVGVFILGYVFSTLLSQIQNRSARTALRATSQALFPAAQRSQEAEAAFQRMMKGFSDAVVMQDASGLDRAADYGRQAVAALKSVTAIPGLAGERARDAGRLGSSLAQLLADAQSSYGLVLSGVLTPETKDQMRALAVRNEQTNAGLTKFKEQLAADLHQQLSGLEQSSARQSTWAFVLFVGTLMVAGVIVHWTVRRCITGPVVRVIGGIQEAAGETARASSQMAQFGLEVSNSAQEQAACIQETSASLEEISTTTRQNADRAAEADRLMREAHQTARRAEKAIDDLASSMKLISKSSGQVASILKDIDEIAFHTNILSLNAAVEAARAGQAGAGFSVVADEVRSLAHRAADAARNSSSIIEKTLGDVSNGVHLVGHAHLAFQEVSAQIASGAQLVSQIAASSGEQAIGIAGIGHAITRIESLTQHNVINAQQTADGANAMATQVEVTHKYLDELVGVVGLHNT